MPITPLPGCQNCSPLTVADTATVDLGIASDELTANVKVSADSGNALSAHSDGLYATAGGGGSSDFLRLEVTAPPAVSGADVYPTFTQISSSGSSISLDADQNTIHILASGEYEISVWWQIHWGSPPATPFSWWVELDGLPAISGESFPHGMLHATNYPVFDQSSFVGSVTRSFSGTSGLDLAPNFQINGADREALSASVVVRKTA